MKLTVVALVLMVICLMVTPPSIAAPTKVLTFEQILKLGDLEKNLSLKKVDFEAKTKSVKEDAINLPKGEDCKYDEDCPSGYICVDMVEKLKSFLQMKNSISQFDFITHKIAMNGKECWKDIPHTTFNQSFASELDDRVIKSKTRLQSAYTRLEQSQIWLDTPLALAEKTGSNHFNLPETETEQTDMNDLISIMNILSSRGNKQDPLHIDNLLSFLILNSAANSTTRTEGAAANLVQNPLLFYTLVNSDNQQNSNNLLLMTILSSAINVSNSTQLISSPLVFKSMIESSAIKNNDLLPILCKELSEETKSNSPACTVSLLLDDNDDLEMSDLLPLLLVSSIEGAGIDVTDILPVLLMSEKVLQKATSNPLLLISLLGLKNSTGPPGMDVDNILPILLSNDNADDDNLILSILSRMHIDYSALLPVMVSDSENMDKITTFLLVSGIEQEKIDRLLPLLLSEDASLVRTDDLLLLMMICRGRLQEMDLYLPLLLQSDDGVDNNMLMIMAIFARLHKNDIKVDENGVQISKDSPLNLLLPMMLLEKDESSDFSDMLLLTLFVSQQQQDTRSEI